MCQQCVKEEFPQRDNICLDNGSYFLNFSGCAQCQRKDALVIENRNVEQLEDNDQELVTYKHVCEHCGHVVANHEYRFDVDEEFQTYEMNCLLCGTAEDERSIMPYDPRQQAQLF